MKIFNLLVFLIVIGAFGCGTEKDALNSNYSKLPKTGQTQCFDSNGSTINCANTGQDGQSHVGIKSSDFRFIDNGNGTITDNFTGLMWAKDGGLVQGNAEWNDAEIFIKNYQNTAGFSDWRMPNSFEMESLIDAGRSNPAISINNPFVHISDGGYWTSTTFGENSEIIDLFSGEIFSDFRVSPFSKYDILPVRNTFKGEINIFQTGQKDCFNEDGNVVSCENTEQDGRYLAGTAWPNPRFIDNNNDTIYDSLTGLTWTKSTNLAGFSMTWQKALEFVNDINAGLKPNFGYQDWRMPNRKELTSIVDWNNPTAPPIIFTDRSQLYWSSTTDENTPTNAWQINFSNDGAQIISREKNNSAIIWAVRSDDFWQ